MPKQVDKYTAERQEVLQKMFSILGINENNNTFLLHELDSNIEKQNKILDLEPEIKKYFICGSWSCFKNDTVKNKALSIIKSLVKNMGLQVMITVNAIKGDDGVPKKRKVYHIVKSI